VCTLLHLLYFVISYSFLILVPPEQCISPYISEAEVALAHFRNTSPLWHVDIAITLVDDTYTENIAVYVSYKGELLFVAHFPYDVQKCVNLILMTTRPGFEWCCILVRNLQMRLTKDKIYRIRRITYEELYAYLCRYLAMYSRCTVYTLG